jgi:hypothetical protein
MSEHPHAPGFGRRVVFGVVGGLVLLVGIALLVLPGPGMLLVLAGLVLLSNGFPAVARFVEPVRTRALQGMEESVASPLRIAFSIATGLFLVAAGVVWGLYPDLPFGGWPTGSSMILSGLIVWGLVVYSHRRVQQKRSAQGVEERADLPGDRRATR